ncbi:hypothetical protein DTL42_11355 [Bremerella cremea]|uniref:Uncharacterized protein n=1 Tax=Bremerella cremea TaxID=1031537 RepID=A0A368KQK7_9BACT|nr:hypothetical protein [Bremerella cremea]RCS49133.1 hypothetical protein DTL42_11355 [Bremerella cremea]
MVSSNGFFGWMDAHPSSDSPEDYVTQSHSTLWISDHDPCVDSLLNRVTAQFGDPVARFPADVFESSQNLVREIRGTTTDWQQLDVIVVGHPCFLPVSQLVHGSNEFSENDNLNLDSLTMRVTRKQRQSKLAEQRLLGVSAQLAQACTMLDHLAIRHVLVTPMFFRPESGAICFYDERTSGFQAIGRK